MQLISDGYTMSLREKLFKHDQTCFNISLACHLQCDHQSQAKETQVKTRSDVIGRWTNQEWVFSSLIYQNNDLLTQLSFPICELECADKGDSDCQLS